MRLQQTRDVVVYAQKYISGKTLDLGAGYAKYRNIIKEKTQDYLTFDLVQEPNIDVVGDALNLPFESGTFDTIISTQVLEHIEKPWVMVKEIGRVLKSGGVCILTAPFMEPFHPDPGDFFRYTVEGMKSLFKNEGFEVVECSGYGKVFSVVASFLKFLWFNPFQKSKRGGRRATNLIYKIARFFDRFSKNKIIYSDVYIIARKI